MQAHYEHLLGVLPVFYSIPFHTFLHKNAWHGTTCHQKIAGDSTKATHCRIALSHTANFLGVGSATRVVRTH